jgi:hypothetical protein
MRALKVVPNKFIIVAYENSTIMLRSIETGDILSVSDIEGAKAKSLHVMNESFVLLSSRCFAF